MPEKEEVKFNIREKIKYGEEYNWEETKAWMKDTQEACEADYAKISEDYKLYMKSDFAALEESIAINIFGITEDYSKRAFKGTCLLRYFNKDQRLLATQTRQKMEEMSGSKDKIEMQVVPIAARMDDDLQRNEKDSKEEQAKKEKNKNTGRIFVFRVKDPNGNPMFLDCQLRTYTNWEDYLTSNKSPQCIMCYPKDGFLRKEKITDGKKYFVANDVEFGEPPSCTLLNRIKGSFDTVVMYASPFIAIGTFWCPASWAWTAYALSMASAGLLYYSLATQGLQLIDQFNHGEDYGASLMTFITSIGTMILNQGLNRYLRGVAAQGRGLTTMENVVITGFLMGLSASQITSFAWMTWSLACKPKLEPMDIVSYAVACHNLYSCIMSPRTANQLLNKVKNEIQAEHQRAISKLEKELKEENWKSNVDEIKVKKLEEKILTHQSALLDNSLKDAKLRLTDNQRRLDNLRAAGGDPEAIAQANREIEAERTTIRELRGEIDIKDAAINRCKMAQENKKLADNQKRLNELRNANEDNAAIAQAERQVEAGRTIVTELKGKIALKEVEFDRSKMAQEKERLVGNQRRLEALRNNGGNAAAIAEIEKEIETGQRTVEELRGKMVTHGTDINLSKIAQESKKVADNERKLEGLRNAGADPATIAEMEREIEAGEAKIVDLERRTLENQQNFLDRKGRSMHNDGARDKYTEFVQTMQEEHGANTAIDQNGRIIKTVTYMDAEMVFKMVSETGSTIQFANGETLDLLINSQLEIHPRAVNQMNRTGQNDLRNMMELTKTYTESTQQDYQGNRQEALATFLREIKPCLKDYQMITRIEIKKVKEDINDRTRDENLRRRFENMTPAEAYRMRTVLDGAPSRGLDLANRMADFHANNDEVSIFTLAAWVEIVKLEVTDFPAPGPLEDSRENRRLYNEMIRNMEVAGLQRQGREPAIAEEMADRNFQRRENLEDAREAHRNEEDVNMDEVARNNRIERFHLDENPPRFENWNPNGSAEDAFFTSLQNENNFNEKMRQINSEINRIGEIARRENLTMSDAITAYYHTRKHAAHSKRHLNDTYNWNISGDQQEQMYLTRAKDFIFDDAFRENKFISQDGSRTSTVYKDGRGYFGVTKCPYDAELGREVGQPTVATHFPR